MNRTQQRLAVMGRLVVCMVLVGLAATPLRAQQTVKWMTVGSLQNWFSSRGCEIEEGRSSAADQQDGLQWPAWYQKQDCQAAKGLWIGCTNYTDSKGSTFQYKVVHVGPRVQGVGEFFPISMETVSKVAPPVVTVDGAVSEGNPVGNDRVDPTISADREIINVVNTAIGITMTRKILQFANQYHDNYMIYDYTFTNTGNINDDPAIELPNQTLTGVYFYWQYRLSPVFDVRYVIGNPTSWGKNAMNDARGDGYLLPTTHAEDTDDSVNVPGVYTSRHMRAQFVWHGKFPPFTQYDNIGAPIWVPYYDPTDTTGRLGAPHFVGHVTIHADKSATDQSDDFAQPSTTSFEGSDDPEASGNDQFNNSKMQDEYTNWIQRGHSKGRHAWTVEPQGLFDQPTGDPALGTTGGFSNADGFGPYTLAPGQSIHIVLAEGAAGLDRQHCIDIGRKFKAGSLSAKAKDDSVLTGKDSLFQTFRRAIANYMTNYNAPSAPPPVASFSVTSGDPIALTWEVTDPGNPDVTGYQIYRCEGRYDGEYLPIATAGPADRSYNDITAIRGVAYYYYIVTVGNPALNTGAALTPQTNLVSNRAMTQTYQPAYRIASRPPGATMADIRIVPNPYVISSDLTRLRFNGEPDKIAFFNIPGRCRIKVYTELGEQIAEIDHENGKGDDYWKSITSSRQIVVSGIYIVTFENLDTGEKTYRKLSIIR